MQSGTWVLIGELAWQERKMIGRDYNERREYEYEGSFRGD